MNTPKFPVREFIQEELDERGWRLEDLLNIIKADAETTLTLELLMHAPTKGATLDDKTAGMLATAFGTSSDFWMNIDRRWQEAA